EANKQESAQIIMLGDQTITPAEYVYDFSFPREDGSPNPHLWTNPRYALRYAQLVHGVLVARDPANREYYDANLASYTARLEELDAAIARTITSIPPENRKLLTYHDSWAYFAPVYGMEVVGAIQPADFAEPSAREVAELIAQVREAKVPAIFGSEVFPSPVLERIGQEAGVKYVDSLRDDDLPGEPGEPRHSYVGLMVEDVRIMAENLGGDPALIADFDPRNVPGVDGAVKQAQ
ncbi:MAG TPA: metal ABC transporter substrate-binding protein, partial [Herpetosiphonaceae bacterium]|nr:metal ABC transporter substrate-binding protein [Herpetosiphonaceae bacterium]